MLAIGVDKSDKDVILCFEGLLVPSIFPSLRNGGVSKKNM